MTRQAFPKPTRAERLARAEEARVQRNGRLAGLRRRILLRSGGRCENPECRRGRVALELDHWLSGSGQRRQAENLWTLWFLCVPCHFDRTRNSPSASYWNSMFSRHCATHWYPPPILHREK